MVGPRIRVLLADDSAITRRALSDFLEGFPDIEIVGEAPSGSMAVDLTKLLVPDVVVMDIFMPEINGIDATRVIRSELPQVAVVGLSMTEEADYGDAMRQAGASDFVSKAAPPNEVITAIRACGPMPRS